MFFYFSCSFIQVDAPALRLFSIGFISLSEAVDPATLPVAVDRQFELSAQTRRPLAGADILLSTAMSSADIYASVGSR